MDKIVILKISNNGGVDLNGTKLRSTSEIAQALEKMSAEDPGVTVSIEASDSIHYESVGKAIYGM